MSAWRSPLLYLGFAAILAAAAALVAPLFIDWAAYRAEFEDYGRKLTGRDVAITGRIEARLFPWPVLILNRVKVANPDGARIENLMEARRIEIRMALSPLISGHVEVNSIVVDRPTFAFERLPTGVGSWQVEPEQGLGALFNPDRVAISGITIRNGTVYAGDDRRGGLAQIDNVSATLSAPALSGPWRMRALASYGDAPVEIGLTTGKLRAGEPIKLGLRVAPAEGQGMVYSFDGEVGRNDAKSVKGSLKIAPTLASSGKSDAEVGFKPFVVRSEVEADFDSVTMTELEIAPEHAADVANFMTGGATIELGKRITVAAALSASRIDVDQIAGRKGRELLGSPDALDALARFLSGLPQGLELDLDLSVTSLIIGGETLEASRLRVEMTPERMRIDEFATGMPGQTLGRFSGLFVFGDGEPLMSGDLKLDSVSLRDFVIWALPEQRREIEEVWSGVRGRLKVEGKLDLAPGRFRLSDARASLDEATLTGSFSLQQGNDPRLAMRLTADRVNIDRYIPQGPTQFSDQTGAAVGLVDLIGRSMAFGDFQFTAQADRLQVNGVEAEDIAIDVGANENGVELRTVEIGRVGAARMDITGLIRFPGEGVAGSMNALVDAEDPRGLLRLLGAFGPEGEAEPAWAKELGPLDLKLVAEASSENSITTAAMALTGTAGDTVASLSGRFRGERAKWQEGDVQLSGEANAASSALLAAVTGINVPSSLDGPAKLTGSATGSLRRGLATAVEAELFGARAQFAGTLREGRTMLEADGRLAILAERAGEVLAVFGLPGEELSPLARVLSAETGVAYDGTGLRLTGLSGTAGGAAFTGDLKVTFDPTRRITGKIATGRLSLPWLLEALLMPRDGQPHDLSSRFAIKLPDIAAVELALTADTLEALPGVAIEAAEASLELDSWQIAMAVKGTGPAGEPASGEIEVKLDSRGAEIDGRLEGKLDLGDLLLADDGTRVLNGDGRVHLKFSGSGRSPAGLLAAARADGTYELPHGVLKRVDPLAFARDLATAKQPSEVDGLISKSLRSGDTEFTGGSGTLMLANGVLTAKPLPIEGEGMTGELRFLLEPASGEVDLSFTLALLEPKGIPAFDLAYAGHPRALQPSSNTQELKSHLAMKLLMESIDQLEELQRQERQLIEEEEQFRREQQERRETENELQRRVRELTARRRISEQEAAAREQQAQDGGTAPGGQGETAQDPNAVTVRPLDAPAEGQPESLPAPADHAAAPAASGPVPLPQEKPEQDAQAASGAASSEPLQVPVDGNIGRTPEPIFSGPTVLQPGLFESQPRRVGQER